MIDPSSAPPCVLVVADPERTGEVVGALSEPLPTTVVSKIEVLSSTGGDEAMERFEARRPHVVVVTATLVTGDTAALVEALRRMAPRSEVGLVVIGDPEGGAVRHAIDAIELAPDRFVSRPMAPRTLRFAVASALEAVMAARQPGAPAQGAAGAPPAAPVLPPVPALPGGAGAKPGTAAGGAGGGADAIREAQRRRWAALADSMADSDDDDDEAVEPAGAAPAEAAPAEAAPAEAAPAEEEAAPLSPPVLIRPRRAAPEPELAVPPPWTPVSQRLTMEIPVVVAWDAPIEAPVREQTLIIRDPSEIEPLEPPPPVSRTRTGDSEVDMSERVRPGERWSEPIPLAALLDRDMARDTGRAMAAVSEADAVAGARELGAPEVRDAGSFADLVRSDAPDPRAASVRPRDEGDFTLSDRIGPVAVRSPTHGPEIDTERDLRLDPAAAAKGGAAPVRAAERSVLGPRAGRDAIPSGGSGRDTDRGAGLAAPRRPGVVGTARDTDRDTDLEVARRAGSGGGRDTDREEDLVAARRAGSGAHDTDREADFAAALHAGRDAGLGGAGAVGAPRDATAGASRDTSAGRAAGVSASGAKLEAGVHAGSGTGSGASVHTGSGTGAGAGVGAGAGQDATASASRGENAAAGRETGPGRSTGTGAARDASVGAGSAANTASRDAGAGANAGTVAESAAVAGSDANRSASAGRGTGVGASAGGVGDGGTGSGRIAGASAGGVGDNSASARASAGSVRGEGAGAASGRVAGASAGSGSGPAGGAESGRAASAGRAPGAAAGREPGSGRHPAPAPGRSADSGRVASSSGPVEIGPRRGAPAAGARDAAADLPELLRPPLPDDLALPFGGLGDDLVVGGNAPGAGLRLEVMADLPDDAPPAPSSTADGRDFARQLRAKMSQMAQRLFQSTDAPAPAPADLAPRHDHSTEFDLSTLGEDLPLGGGAALEGRAAARLSIPPELVTSPGSWDSQVRERGLPDQGEIVRGVSDAPMLLAKMFAGGSTGRVGFRRGDVETVVSFDQGRPVFASSSETRDRMGELLVREGKITAAQYERCQGIVAESGRRMGEILVDFGYLKRRELLPAVRRHVEDIVYALFGWDRGQYRISIEAQPTAERIRLSRHPAALILEGIRRKLNRTTLERLVGAPSTIIEVGDRERLGGIINMGDLTTEERAALAAFDGQTDLEQAARAAGIDVADVLPLAWGLTVLGLATARRTDTDVHEETTALVGETDLAIDRERVRARWQLVTEADYFALLGVRRDATAFEIRRAYQAARRDFAADGFPSDLRRELARELDDIANVLDEAFRVLRDDRLRQTYLSNLIE